jgi:hypothetical protein
MFKWMAKKGLERSESEIIEFISQIEGMSSAELAFLMSRAAILHASLNKNDFDIGISFNSKLGERQKQITIQIVHLNGLMNELRKSGMSDLFAAAKLWNITLRCLSNNSFAHYGKTIWSLLDPSELIQEIEFFIREANTSHTKEAIGLAGYLPPAFSS